MCTTVCVVVLHPEYISQFWCDYGAQGGRKCSNVAVAVPWRCRGEAEMWGYPVMTWDSNLVQLGLPLWCKSLYMPGFPGWTGSMLVRLGGWNPNFVTAENV